MTWSSNLKPEASLSCSQLKAVHSTPFNDWHRLVLQNHSPISMLISNGALRATRVCSIKPPRVLLGFRENNWSCLPSVRYLSSRPSSIPSVTTFPSTSRSESAYSILLVPGGWESTETFAESAAKFAALGFESSVLSFVNKSTVSGQVAEVAQAMQHLGPFTLIVAYSISGFVVQKFLESHACAGCVLVNSLPPDPKPALRRLVDVENDAEYDKALDGMKYTGIFQSLLDPPTVPVADLLIGNNTGSVGAKLLEICGSPQTQLLKDVYSQQVNLEPGAVPTLILQSELDEFIGVEDAQRLASFHNAELQFIPDAFHVTTLNKKANSKIVRETVEWIDRVL